MESFDRHNNSGFGKNLSILPAKLNKFIEVSESVTIEKLLNFQENYVKNFFLYDENSETFKFEHKDGEYIAKANARLSSKNVDFSAVFIEGLSVEYGISYVGVIRIVYDDEFFDIKVPGELSYDPGSKVDDKI